MKEIKLFDYQEDMKERIEKALRLHRSVMAQMPTGTGKTVLLASVVESFLREHSNCNVWIVAHRRELVSQIRETIQRVFFESPRPSFQRGLHFLPKPLFLRKRGCNRPTRCSEPLRSKVGGPSKVSPDCAGWDRLTATCLRSADGLAATCLRSAEGLGDRLGERGGDGLGATSASSVNPTSDMMPIKAVSIQWLAKHYDEIEEEPGMIVIDEAHHALAKTYKEMWERFPNAKFLGLTATPCRLNGKGFTDLFDVLVQSWSVPEFISKGRLATYDFVSIKSDSVTQRLIDSLQKRGADGDYQNKEMDMLLNKKPSIERLYRSLEEYGKDRKGIVYAINIRHANAIAEFYREHGIAAVAIDSKTPSSLRKELIERFKASSNTSNTSQYFSKITPSLFTLKEGSTSHPGPLSSGAREETAPPRRSEPLRSKVGGPSKVSPDCLSASAFNVPIKAVSIQWLSKHYDEIEEEPGLIVIDEAHHALAKTYKEMWERFPKAKFLGLTATPCRLNGKGFTDLFDVLVQSWDVPEFISKGRLATYDFVSIKSDGVTQRLIDSLQKRGADGDYQNKEMDMLLNKKPSIERLYRSLEEFGKDRKGIVYAINISHANAIAEFYREHGIAAVAIDSKTPSSLRKELIERFKSSNTSFSNHPDNFSKTHPSSLTLKRDLSNHPVPLSKEGSTSHPDPLTLRGQGM